MREKNDKKTKQPGGVEWLAVVGSATCMECGWGVRVSTGGLAGVR